MIHIFFLPLSFAAVQIQTTFLLSPTNLFSAHPNLKLFISHGGLLGIMEAISEGIPVLGIPLFGDQWTNIRKLEAMRAGKLLPYLELNEETILGALETVLSKE